MRVFRETGVGECVCDACVQNHCGFLLKALNGSNVKQGLRSNDPGYQNTG